MSNQSSTTTINNTPKEELNKLMVEMFMMIEEMDIQEGKYLEFAEMFKSMNLNIDRLAGMRQQIIVNTYYQRYVRPQQTVRHHRLTEAEKEKNADYTLCNCGRYVSNVTPKFALKHLNTAVHYQGVRNRKYAHTTFNNEEINAKIKTEVVLQCFIIKHSNEVIKLTVQANRVQEAEEEANRVQRELDEEEDTGEIYIGMPTVQNGLEMLGGYDSDEDEAKTELGTALMGCLEEALMRDEYWEENPHYQCDECGKKCKCRMDFCQCDKFVAKTLNYCNEDIQNVNDHFNYCEGDCGTDEVPLPTICDECLGADED